MEIRAGVLKGHVIKEDEMDVLIKFLDKKDKSLQTLNSILSKEDFKMLLDAFSGKSLRLPDREKVIKSLQYVRIYNFCKARTFSDSSYTQAAKLFNKKEVSIKSIVSKVRTIVDETL